MNTGLHGALVVAALSALLAGCGGGAGNGGTPVASPNALTTADVGQVIAQAVAEAQARNAQATIAVVDRVGNVLAVFNMNGAPAQTTISSQTGVTGGLEGQAVPSPAAAIAMAVTGAYLSSQGNAFSTRTASQIVQQNFNPGETNQPSGPLFGVQFSSLPCSDVTASAGTLGPKPTPLGLAANPGGLPLYKNGTLVGGVGVISDGLYTLDLNIQNVDSNQNELIAVAATYGFAAPSGLQANQIAVNGRSLRYVDSTNTASNPAQAPPFSSLSGVGSLVNFSVFGGGAIVPGTVFGQPPSGYAPSADPAFAGLNAYTLVDASGNPRYPFPPPGAYDGLLTQAEVTAILSAGLDVGNRARAQIRAPLGSAAQVSVVVVDTNGVILGLIRSPDAPVFGTDVAVQKARTAAFFSSRQAAAMLTALPDAAYGLIGGTPVVIGSYVAAMQSFVNDPTTLTNGIAYSNRAVGNLSRPFFPDGIPGTPHGPLSKPYGTQWSVFNVGLQLDLIINAVVKPLGIPPPAAVPTNCTGDPAHPGSANPIIRNGIQSFPGSVPIFRGSTLVGAVGVSGDGVDQDDMVAFLGLNNAGQMLQTGIGNAPSAIRADQLVPQGTRLRYVNCPQTPFNNSTAQNVCAGL